jgi:hypothetical protein
VKPPEQRLDESIQGIADHIHNISFRMKNVSSGFSPGRPAPSKEKIKAQFDETKYMHTCCSTNLERISFRLGVIHLALAEIQQRFQQEGNEEGNQAIVQVSDRIRAFRVAMGRLEAAGSEVIAKQSLSHARVAFRSMRDAKEELDRVMGRAPAEPAGT